MTPIREITDLLQYEPSTGEFFWLVSRGGSNAGQRAGSFDRKGYLVIRIKYKIHRAHRLAWALRYGEWPGQDIDHINGDRADNRIENLRLATNSLNQANSKRPAHNTSGHKGVSWHVRESKWQAQIRVNGKKISLGYHRTREEAAAAYAAAARQYFAEFARVE